MKTYVMPSLNDPAIWILEQRQPKPSNAIGPALIDQLTGLYEDPRWLQLENIDDGNGNLIPTITVNEIAKAAIQAQDLTDEFDKETAKQTKKALKDAKKLLLKNFDSKKVTNLAEITSALNDIVEYLKDIDPSIDEVV